jgi:hypothetical protein
VAADTVQLRPDTGAVPLATPFGEVQLVEARRLRLARPMAGLPGVALFQIDTTARVPEPFRLLIGLDGSRPIFVVLPMGDLDRWLKADEIEAAAAALEARREDLAALLIVSLHRGDDGLEAYANRRAPLFVDTSRRVALQLVLADPAYPIRQRLDVANAD